MRAQVDALRGNLGQRNGSRKHLTAFTEKGKDATVMDRVARAVGKGCTGTGDRPGARLERRVVTPFGNIGNALEKHDLSQQLRDGRRNVAHREDGLGVDRTGGMRGDDSGEAEFARFGDAASARRNRANFARKPKLTEGDRRRGERNAAKCGGDGKRNAEVGRGLCNAQAAGNRSVDVVRADVHPGVTF